MADVFKALGAVSGLSESEVAGIWEDVKANQKKLEECDHPHDFAIKSHGVKRNATCRKCGGNVAASQARWYLDGLKHADAARRGEGGVMERIENDWGRKASCIRDEIVELLGTVYPGQTFDMAQMDLRPREKSENLAFGSVIHQALELWYGRVGDANRLLAVLDLIDTAYPNRMNDPTEKHAWHLAKAMMLGYASRYPHEDFDIVAIEQEFEAPIINPETGAESRTFRMGGKVDGVVRLPDGLYLMEHKTAGALTRDYLERLWTDTQIAAYAHYLRETGTPVIGVIYNVLLKTRLKQNAGETEHEYEARKAALAAKNKSGKSTAQRKEPESDEEFRGRLADWYAKPEAFHRERIYLT